ncbi:MAG: hypothetical protein ACJ8D9_22510, partial [Xanthobacteraceae bacterium]
KPGLLYLLPSAIRNCRAAARRFSAGSAGAIANAGYSQATTHPNQLAKISAGVSFSDDMLHRKLTQYIVAETRAI